MATVAVLKNRNTYIVFYVTLIAIMGVASITPAFPSIAETLDISYKKIGLLITAFTLPGVMLTPFLGILADRLGRKTILVPSLLLFGIAGFLCSQTDDFQQLVTLRLIQGIGGASLGSLNVTLIGDIFPPGQRAEAMGYNASVLSIGTAFYPFIGGALASFAWYYPFYFPLLAIPAGFIVLFYLDNPAVTNSETLSEYLLETLKSVLRLKVFGLFLLNIFTFIILYGSYLTYFPLVMKDNFGSGPFIIGIIMSCSSISTAITSGFLGKLTRVFDPKSLLKFAYLLYIVSLLLVPFLRSIYLLIIPAIVFGVAQGINIPNIQNLLVGLAPMKHRAAFMSLNGMVLRIGQTLGPLVAGMFFSLGGLKWAFMGGALVALSMIFIIFGFLKELKPQKQE